MIIDRHNLPRTRGFSLMEVLIAVMILGIGLIMVASVFPVGADWTRQSTDDSVAQTIALNAVSVLQSHYGTGGNLSGNVATISPTLRGIPGFATIPVGERCFQFGNASPFPAANPAACTFYWTALARLDPACSSTSATKSYDVYILVFRKGDATQTFTTTSLPSGYTEVPNVRDTTNPSQPAGFDFHLEPTLIVGPYAAGAADSTGVVQGASPLMGSYGIGVNSGTVFRQIADTSVSPVTAKPSPKTTTTAENVIFSPPADNTSTSPLVYVYQTTLSF